MLIGCFICTDTIDNVDSDVRKYQTERGLYRAKESCRQTIPFAREPMIDKAWKQGILGL